MGAHGVLQAPPPVNQPERDPQEHVQQYGAEDNGRREGPNGRGRGQMGHAEEKGGDRGRDPEDGRRRRGPAAQRGPPDDPGTAVSRKSRSSNSSAMPP